MSTPATGQRDTAAELPDVELPRLRVTVLPEDHRSHWMQIYAGLTELAARGRLELRYFGAQPPDAPPPVGVIWLVAEDPATGRSMRMCVDLHDGPAILSPEGLDRCDLYYKRSLHPSTLAQLSDRDRARIRPVGLNCFLVGDQDHDLWRRLLLERRLRQASGRPLPRAEVRPRLRYLASVYRKPWWPSSLRRACLARASDLVAPPQRDLSDVVVMQARVWSREDAPHAADREPMNEQRAELVRVLRRAFGRRFQGGLVPSELARARFDDCLSTLPTDQTAWLALVREARVGVVTLGLHGSIPWKLPEYLAASRCVVSERFEHVLTAPLESGRHVEYFGTLDECAGACERLLSDPGRARAMQAANADYYARFVSPQALVARMLIDAIGHSAPTS